MQAICGSELGRECFYRLQAGSYTKNQCFRGIASETGVEISRNLTHLAAMKSVVAINPEILSGTPVFAGTRVPVKNLTDSLEGGSTIAEFLDDFPSVTRAQVIAFLEEAREALATPAK